MSANGKFGSLSIDVVTPSRMFIELPDGSMIKDNQGREAYIDFLPLDSEPGRKYDQEQNREFVRKGFRQRSKAEQRAEIESLDTIKIESDKLTALVTGWHLVDIDGTVLTEPAFSKDNAHAMFMDPGMGWLRRQCWTFVSSERNFMKGSSKTSVTSPSTNSGSTDPAAPAAPNATT